jgi:hypothetical protein
MRRRNGSKDNVYLMPDGSVVSQIAFNLGA